MSVKDKVANYLTSFLDLEEWHSTRDDPHGIGALARAKQSKERDTATSSGWPREREVRASIKAGGSAPLSGSLGGNTALATGTERAKATEPTLSPGARASEPEHAGVKPVRADTHAPTGLPHYKSEPVGGSKSPEHTGGLQAPRPQVGPAPAHLQAGLKNLAKSHSIEQGKKMDAAGKHQAAAIKATGDQRDLDVLSVSRPGSASDAGRTSKQRHNDNRSARRAGLRLGTVDPKVAPPNTAMHNPAIRTRMGNHEVEPKSPAIGRVATSVTAALIGATKDQHKRDVLRKQERPFNNTGEPEAARQASAPAPAPSQAPAKKFVSQEVLADLRNKKAKEKK
jgi:hypothetical protein